MSGHSSTKVIVGVIYLITSHQSSCMYRASSGDVTSVTDRRIKDLNIAYGVRL